MATRLKTPAILDHFDLDPDAPLIGAGGGHDAYAVSDRRSGEALMAVRVPDGRAPRAVPAGGFPRGSIPGCLTPLGSGVARDGRGRLAQFVICPAPPGPSLEQTGLASPWSEAELLETVLYPVAEALAALGARETSHRAIRPNNVFQAARGRKVVLGCAWVTSPALDQPAPFDPPYSAACPPAWRSEGTVADDVYALGVLVVALAAGAWPLAGLDAADVVARTIAAGSAAAIIGGARLPPVIADVAHGMLAEDPEHRPSPSLLLNLRAARTRRVAARPRRRAQRLLEIGSQSVGDRRALAHALANEPALAIPLLRSGAIDAWLRRSLGDVAIALVTEEAVRQRAAEAFLPDREADAILLLRAVAVLDPLAPLCWLGLRIWPDAIGPGLAASSEAEVAALAKMLEVDAFAAWAVARPERSDPVGAQMEARALRLAARQGAWGNGVARLRYARNPLLPCRAPLLAGAVVVGLPELLPALERTAGQPDRPALPFDAELAAFVAARLGLDLEAHFTLMGRMAARHAASDVARSALAQMRVLAQVQEGPAAIGTPQLAAWLAAACEPVLAAIRSRARRDETRTALARHVAAGRFADMLGVLEDPARLEADQRDAAEAEANIARLAAEIDAAERRSEAARANATRLGREVVASCGVVALTLAIVMAAL